MFTFRDTNGNVQTIDGQVWTGLRDARGHRIFDGDRIHVYIPALDGWRDGTVVWSFADGEPSSFVIRLDTPYMQGHFIAPLRGAEQIPVTTHYLEGGSSCYLLEEAK